MALSIENLRLNNKAFTKLVSATKMMVFRLLNPTAHVLTKTADIPL